MKRKFIMFLIAMFAILPSCFLFSACGDNSGNGSGSGSKTLTQEEIKAYIPTSFELNSGMGVKVHQFGENFSITTTTTVNGVTKETTIHDALFEKVYFKDSNGNDIYSTINYDRLTRNTSSGKEYFYVESGRNSYITYNGKSYNEDSWASKTNSVVNGRYNEYKSYVNPMVTEVAQNTISDYNDNLLEMLAVIERATNYNATMSREILGDDYEVKYDYKKENVSSKVQETATLTARFVINMTSDMPTRVEDYWYPVAETCVMRIDAKVVYLDSKIQKLELRLTYDPKYNPESKLYETGELGSKKTPIIYEGVDLTFTYGNTLEIPTEKIEELAPVSKTTLHISDEALPEDFSKSVATGEMLTLPNLTAEGKTFDGWYFDSECKHKVKDNQFVPEGGDVTLTTRWKYAEPELELNGGTLSSFAEQNFDQVKSYHDLLNVFTEKDGYAFVGWYTDPELTIRVDYNSDEDYKGEKLYAKYEKLVTLTPVIEQGLNYKVIPQTGKAGTKLFLPKETDLGFKFDNWYYEDESVVGSVFPTESQNVYLKVTKGIVVTIYQAKAPFEYYTNADKDYIGRVYQFTANKGVSYKTIERQYEKLYNELNEDTPLKDRLNGKYLLKDGKDGNKYYYKQLLENEKQTIKTNLLNCAKNVSSSYNENVTFYPAYTQHDKVRIKISMYHYGYNPNLDPEQTGDCEQQWLINDVYEIVDLEQWEYNLNKEEPQTMFDSLYLYSNSKWEEVSGDANLHLRVQKFKDLSWRTAWSSLGTIVKDKGQLEYERSIVKNMREKYDAMLEYEINSPNISKRTEEGDYPSTVYAYFSTEVILRNELHLHRGDEEKVIYIDHMNTSWRGIVYGTDKISLSTIGLPLSLQHYIEVGTVQNGKHESKGMLLEGYAKTSKDTMTRDGWKSADFPEGTNLSEIYYTYNGQIFEGYYTDKDYTNAIFTTSDKTISGTNYDDDGYNGRIYDLYLKYVDDIKFTFNFTAEELDKINDLGDFGRQTSVLALGVNENFVKDTSEFGERKTPYQVGDEVSFNDRIKLNESTKQYERQDPVYRENVSVTEFSSGLLDSAIEQGCSDNIYEFKKDTNGNYYINFSTIQKCNNYNPQNVGIMLNSILCVYSLEVRKSKNYTEENGETVCSYVEKLIAKTTQKYYYEAEDRFESYAFEDLNSRPEGVNILFTNCYDKETNTYKTECVLNLPFLFDADGKLIISD